jgi:hypothetical protein
MYCHIRFLLPHFSTFHEVIIRFFTSLQNFNFVLIKNSCVDGKHTTGCKTSKQNNLPLLVIFKYDDNIKTYLKETEKEGVA